MKIHNALSLVFYVDTSDVKEIKSAINELYDLLTDEQPVLVKEFTLWLNNLFITAGYEMKSMDKIIGKMKSTEEVKAMFLTSVKEHDKKVEQMGMQKRTIDIARKMLIKGIELEIIIDVTGLSLEELQKIKLK